MSGFDEQASKLHHNFLDYHHLVNPFCVDDWINSFKSAGLVTEEHIPILPKNNSGIFLLMDNLWHIKREIGGEIGDAIFPFLSKNANFPSAFRKIFAGLLEMESEWEDCSGAVFLVRKPN
jgi:hypothetical protein